MANGTGTAVIDFGAHPGSNEAVVAVTGQGAISGTSKAEAFIMGDDTTGDHIENDHRYAPELFSVTCGTPTAAVGFSIFGRSVHKMHGQWALRWVWSD